MKPGGQLSLIARPNRSPGSSGPAAALRRHRDHPLWPRAGENAVRILVSAIKQSRKRLRCARRS